MPTLEQQIEALDDTTAARLLRVFARANSATEQGLALTADLKEGLEKCADVTPLTAAPINEGDMARSALLFLGSEPDYREGLAALVANPPPQRMLGPWETMALASAVLVVLQTHFKFERDKQGRWTVNLEKKPTNTELLTAVIQKLLGM
jgi:hypothetical protein